MRRPVHRFLAWLTAGVGESIESDAMGVPIVNLKGFDA